MNPCQYDLISFFSLIGTHISSSEVTALQHELRNDSVELATLVAEALLPSAKSTEVFGGLRDDVVVEVEVDSAGLGWQGKKGLVTVPQEARAQESGKR